MRGEKGSDCGEKRGYRSSCFTADSKRVVWQTHQCQRCFMRLISFTRRKRTSWDKRCVTVFTEGYGSIKQSGADRFLVHCSREEAGPPVPTGRFTQLACQRRGLFMQREPDKTGESDKWDQQESEGNFPSLKFNTWDKTDKYATIRYLYDLFWAFSSGCCKAVTLQ